MILADRWGKAGVSILTKALNEVCYWRRGWNIYDCMEEELKAWILVFPYHPQALIIAERASEGDRNNHSLLTQGIALWLIYQIIQKYWTYSGGMDILLSLWVRQATIVPSVAGCETFHKMSAFVIYPASIPEKLMQKRLQPHRMTADSWINVPVAYRSLFCK